MSEIPISKTKVNGRKKLRRDLRNEIELRKLFPFVHAWPKPNFSRGHLELLGQTLRRTLRQRDYVRAFRMYNVMTSALHVSEELVWKIGCEFLMQKKEYEPQCLRFLQLILAKSKRCKTSIIIETALYQLRSGKPEDALTTLEPYINIYPYNEEPLLLAYAGLVEFALWNKALREKVSDQFQDGLKGKERKDLEAEIEHEDWLESEDDPDPNVRQLNLRISRYGHSAANLLEMGLRIDPKNDMFLKYLVWLKCGNFEMEGFAKKKLSRKRRLAIHEMKGYLKKFYNSNNDSILCLKYIAALENRTVQQTLEQILNQDPAADSELYVLPLLKILEQDLPPGQQTIIENIVSKRYKGNPRTPRDSNHEAMINWIEEQPDLSQIESTIQIEPYSTDDPKKFLDFQQHQPNIKYIRPILKLLLMRAEFGVMTDGEEKQMELICNTFCFCSFYCRRASGFKDVMEKPQGISFFDQLSPSMQPSWYSKLAAILYRKDEP